MEWFCLFDLRETKWPFSLNLCIIPSDSNTTYITKYFGVGRLAVVFDVFTAGKVLGEWVNVWQSKKKNKPQKFAFEYKVWYAKRFVLVEKILNKFYLTLWELHPPFVLG